MAVAFIDGACRLAFRCAHFARRRRLGLGSECNCDQGSWLVWLASMDMGRDYLGKKPVFGASNGQLPSRTWSCVYLTIAMGAIRALPAGTCHLPGSAWSLNAHGRPRTRRHNNHPGSSNPQQNRAIVIHQPQSAMAALTPLLLGIPQPSTSPTPLQPRPTAVW